MVWLSSDQSNQANVSQYVADYVAHNLTVGGLDVDSAWSTGFNNFVIDQSKFQDMGALVTAMHEQGINVILWATSAVDTDSSNYEFALNSSYFIENGFKEPALIKWWHGVGGLLDYFNPVAKAWWEQQLDGLLALGIDGWKVDGTDPYLVEVLTPYSPGADAYITLQQYQDQYYGHFFNYSRQVNGPHCLIWSRPVDSYPMFLNLSAYLEFSPKYVMASGWVGDQDPTFAGFQDALINMFESAWRGYANFGSDTGGYRAGNRTGELLLRWAQANAFLPLFENGGDGEHRPWMFDAPGSTFFVDAYRRLVAAHYELGPYLLATGTAALLSNTSSITPHADPPADFPFIVQPDQLTDFSFSLGADVFVAPVVAANVSSVLVHLPAGTAASDSWYEYWNPSRVHAANSTFSIATPLNASAVFVRTGSIVPLHVSTAQGSVAYGDLSFGSALTAVVHSPAITAPSQRVRTVVPGWQELGAELSYSYGPSTIATNADVEPARQLVFEATPLERDLIVVLRGLALPSTARTTLSAGSLEALQAAAELSFNVSVASSTCGAVSAALPFEGGAATVKSAGHAATMQAAVSWDAAASRPLRPIARISEELRKSAAPLVCTWSVVPVLEDANDNQVVDVVIRAGAGDAGVRIVVTHAS
jgi:hypothetical protein